jgi:hypothetical protein
MTVSIGGSIVSGGITATTAPIVTSGLLLYADAAYGYSGSGTTWNDMSSVNNTGTLINSPTWTQPGAGGYFTFNGVNQLSQYSSTLFNTAYTGKTVFVAARMNNSSWTPGVAQYRCMFGSTGGNRNFNFYMYHDASNLYYLHFSATGGGSSLSNAISVTTNTWYIFALTQSSTTVSYYLNNSLVNAITGQTLGQYLTTTNENIAVSDNYWYGDIGFCAIYSKELTTNELTQNYNAIRGRFGL